MKYDKNMRHLKSKFLFLLLLLGKEYCAKGGNARDFLKEKNKEK